MLFDIVEVDVVKCKQAKMVDEALRPGEKLVESFERTGEGINELTVSRAAA